MRRIYQRRTRRMLAPLDNDEMRTLARMMSDAGQRATTAWIQAGYYKSMKLPQQGLMNDLNGLGNQLRYEVSRRDRKYT